MDDQVYVKVLLYAYPHLRELADASEEGARIKAYLSFRRTDTLDCAERVAREILAGGILRGVADELDGIVQSLDEQERFLLEYKYFRRRSELARYPEEAFSGSEREYFRRQQALVRRIAYLLFVHGLTAQRYFEEIGSIPPFPRLYRAVEQGRERAVVPKRGQRGISFAQNSASGSATGAFLPRSRMNTVKPMTATTRQTSTICSTEGVSRTSGVSALPGAPVSTER